MSNVEALDAELVFGRVRPTVPGVHVSSKPVWLTVGYTLSISSRFLLKHALGNGTIAAADALIDWYWRKIIASGNAELWAEGRKHIPSTAVVVMTNHASLLDIPALMGTFPHSLRMVSKEEITNLPIWGQALKASGFVPVNRKNRTQAIAQLEVAKAQLRRGVSVWISPEGTRSRSAKLMPFKKGGFHIAVALGVPVVPGFIEGSETVLPPDTFKVRQDGRMTVRYGAPIPTAHVVKNGEVDADGFAQLMVDVRTAVLALSKLPPEKIDGAWTPPAAVAPPSALKRSA